MIPPEVPSRKRRKPNPHVGNGKPMKKAHPINELKSQIRSLRRLLSHDDDDRLPATVRVEKERALRSLEGELEQTLAHIRGASVRIHRRCFESRNPVLLVLVFESSAFESSASLPDSKRVPRAGLSARA